MSIPYAVFSIPAGIFCVVILASAFHSLWEYFSLQVCFFFFFKYVMKKKFTTVIWRIPAKTEWLAGLILDTGKRRSLPLTWCSKVVMTETAECSMVSLVWALSCLRCNWHILPSSLNASLMSRTRMRSLALLAWRRSFSFTTFCSGESPSSSDSLLQTNGNRRP